jgi:hypothetical protein
MRVNGRDLAQVVMRNEKTDAEFGSRANAIYLLPSNDLYRLYLYREDILVRTARPVLFFVGEGDIFIEEIACRFWQFWHFTID